MFSAVRLSSAKQFPVLDVNVDVGVAFPLAVNAPKSFDDELFFRMEPFGAGLRLFGDDEW